MYCPGHNTTVSCRAYNVNTGLMALYDACKGRSLCSVPFTMWSIMGDPCPNVVKYLYTSYLCGGSAQCVMPRMSCHTHHHT